MAMTYTDADFDALTARVVALEATTAALTSSINLLPTLAAVNTIISALEDSVAALGTTSGSLDVSIQRINRMLTAQGTAISDLISRVEALEA